MNDATGLRLRRLNIRIRTESDGECETYATDDTYPSRLTAVTGGLYANWREVPYIMVAGRYVAQTYH
jgi:hypothetical protein